MRWRTTIKSSCLRNRKTNPADSDVQRARSDERKRFAKRVEDFKLMQERLAPEREERINHETERTRALLKQMRQKLKSS